MTQKLSETLILMGSPHENGYTSKLLEHILKILPNTKISVKNAFKENVFPCIDCAFCKTNSRCVFEDMDETYDLLEKCDILIIAFPVYNSSLPSPLKSMIDRMQKYYNLKFFLKINPFLKKSKKSLIITTQGSKDDRVESVLKFQLNPVLKLLNCYENSWISVKFTDKNNFDIDKYYVKSENEIKNTINNLYSDFLNT